MTNISDNNFETFEGWSELLQSEEQERIPLGGSEEEETVPLQPSEERESPSSETPTIQIEGDIYQRLAQSLSLEIIQDIGPIHQDIEEDIENIQNSIDESREEILEEIDGIDEEIVDQITSYLDNELVPHLNRLENNQYELGQIVVEVYRTVEQGFENIPDNVATVDDIPSDYTTQRDLENLYSDLEDLIRDTSDTPDYENVTESINDLSDEYERSSNRLERLRESHEEDMSDQNVSDILYD